MVAIAAAVASFLALSAGAVALVSYAARGSLLDVRIRTLGAWDAAEGDGARANAAFRPSARGLLRLVTSDARRGAIERELRRAGIRLHAGEYLLGRLALVALAFLTPALVAWLHPAGMIVGVAAAAVAYLLPGIFVQSAKRRRIAKVERQLTELLPLLASSLRSGFALPHGIESASQQIGGPLGEEFGIMRRDIGLGAAMQTALQDMRERVGSPDLDIVVTAMLVQRRTGANLADVLDQAAETLRDRERIRGEVRTLTAQQRLTGTILAVYPVGVGLVLLALMPGVWSRLLTEPVGQAQLGVALVLQVVGFVAIRRAANVEF